MPPSLAPLRRLVLAIVGALLLAGCETTPAPSRAATRNPAWIALERTAGEANDSPSYVVTLFEGGGVLFEGRTNVRSRGTFTKHIPAQEAAQLFAELELLDFWSRPNRYDYERAKAGNDDVIARVASDKLPWEVISASRAGRVKRIEGLFFAPQDLLRFKARLEAALGVADYVGPPGLWRRD